MNNKYNNISVLNLRIISLIIGSVIFLGLSFILLFNQRTNLIETLNYSSIEWRPLNYIDLAKDKCEQLLEVLSALEEKNNNLNVPGNIAIAHHLIKAWATKEVN